jgi:hypothetical protein
MQRIFCGLFKILSLQNSKNEHLHLKLEPFIGLARYFAKTLLTPYTPISEHILR